MGNQPSCKDTLLLGSKLKTICDIGYRRLFKYQFPSFIQNTVIITSHWIFAYCTVAWNIVIIVSVLCVRKKYIYGDDCSKYIGFIKFQFSLWPFNQKFPVSFIQCACMRNCVESSLVFLWQWFSWFVFVVCSIQFTTVNMIRNTLLLLNCGVFIHTQKSWRKKSYKFNE